MQPWGVIAFFLVAGVASCAASPPSQAVVRRVVDGDTVELADGHLVRYIGINAPEYRRRARPGDREWMAGDGDRWVVDPEPLAREALEENRRLVEGKTVKLEYDVQTYDRYGRVLAYVYVDGTMVNAVLVEEGYARLLTIPPDVKYAPLFTRLAQEAERARRGLWQAGR